MQKQTTYDEHGFRTSSLKLAVQSLLHNPEQERERVQAWAPLLQHPPSTPEQQQLLKQQVRLGVPAQLRPAVWKLLIIQPRTPYESVTVKSELKEIDRDINRTIPSNRRDWEIQPKLKHVLNLLAVAFPEMGYCQGLNYIAAHILLILDEKQTYQVMSHMLYWQGHGNLMSNLENINAKLYTLSKMTSKLYPQLHKFLAGCEVEPMLYAAPWFITLYNNVLPCEYCYRIMEMYLLEGDKVLYRVALQILKEKKKILKKLTAIEDVNAELKCYEEFNRGLMDKFFAEALQIKVSRRDIEGYEQQYRSKYGKN